MTAYAQEWADKLAREDGFEHRQNNAYGENLYSSWSSNPKAKVSIRLGLMEKYKEIIDDGMENGKLFCSDHGQHSGGQLVLRGEEARLHGGAKDHRDRTLHAGETYNSAWGLPIKVAWFLISK